MPPLVNVKHERYCLARYEGKSKRQSAIAAGFGNGSYGRKLAKRPEIQARIRELEAFDTGATIADKTERREILTEIARARFSDFANTKGSITGKLTRKQLKSAGLQEVVRTRMDKVTLKLRDPVPAIDLLNKMDKIYTDLSPDRPPLINTVVFVFPDGTKITPKELAIGRSNPTPDGNTGG